MEAEAWIRADRPAAALAFRSAVLRGAHLIAERPRSGIERLEIAEAPHRFSWFRVSLIC